MQADGGILSVTEDIWQGRRPRWTTTRSISFCNVSSTFLNTSGTRGTGGSSTHTGSQYSRVTLTLNRIVVVVVVVVVTVFGEVVVVVVVVAVVVVSEDLALSRQSRSIYCPPRPDYLIRLGLLLPITIFAEKLQQ